MKINEEKCVSCTKCVPYCPVDAIVVTDGVVGIDYDECVECGVCFRSAECPTQAIEREELTGPRSYRYIMSDPSAISPKTKVGGRGTVEMKTNDITGRFRIGWAGVGVEVGRPGVGARLYELERIAKELTKIGIEWESDNPITGLMADVSTGEFKSELLNEKVLSGILEFAIKTEQLPKVLETLKALEDKVDTVYSVCVISKLGKNFEDSNLELMNKLGYETAPNMKVNIGLGKPLFHFEEE